VLGVPFALDGYAVTLSILAKYVNAEVASPANPLYFDVTGRTEVLGHPFLEPAGG